MKTKIALTALAAAAALFAQGAFAQASAPASRADVKAETKALEKSGQLTPAGEGPGSATGATNTMSNKTRAERKAETKAARSEGELKPAGQAVGGRTPDTKSTTTRADRKAATKEAVKDRTTIPAGEGPDSPKK